MTIIFRPAPDTTVPASAQDQMRKGRGPGGGATRTLKEISDILYAEGKTDHQLREWEVKRIIDRALEKARKRMTPEDYAVFIHTLHDQQS